MGGHIETFEVNPFENTSMNRTIIRRIFGFAGMSMILLCPFAEAQRLGNTPLRSGGGLRPAAPARPATPPNVSALKSQFGDSSIIHRDAAPNTSRPAIQRTNSLPNATRPNLPNQTQRNLDRSNLAELKQQFGPDNRNQIFNRTDHNTVNRDGPDWKNWQNFDSQRINRTVINKIDIDNRSINVIRDNFNQKYNREEFFTQDWYNKHPNAWCPGLPNPYPPGPRPPYPHPHPPPPPPYWWWSHPSWDHAWGWFAAGFVAGAVTQAVLTPVPYYYGSNIVYVQDTVYVNNVPYVSSTEYYQQAQSIAQAGAVSAERPPKPDTDANAQQQAVQNPVDEWLPMGTFAVVADAKQTESKRILQIATNKQGQVRGNFINQETETATELYGSVDPQTQRVAFKAVGNDSVIAECGLWNLTQDTVPMLVHLDRNRTEERTLVRLTDKSAELPPTDQKN